MCLKARRVLSFTGGVVAPRPAHYAGDYQSRQKALTRAAYANPATTCYHCGRTLDEHPRTRAGNPPTWSAEHVRPADPTSPLAPSVLGCNAAAGRAMQDTQWRVSTKRW